MLEGLRPFVFNPSRAPREALFSKKALGQGWAAIRLLLDPTRIEDAPPDRSRPG